jgi:hypothetical protein
MRVTTTDGKQYTARVDQPLRGPQNLVPPDRLESKFRDCAAKALEAGAISRVYDMLQAFDTLSDIRQATQVMAASVRNRPIARAAA